MAQPITQFAQKSAHAIGLFFVAFVLQLNGVSLVFAETPQASHSEKTACLAYQYLPEVGFFRETTSYFYPDLIQSNLGKSWRIAIKKIDRKLPKQQQEERFAESSIQFDDCGRVVEYANRLPHWDLPEKLTRVFDAEKVVEHVVNERGMEKTITYYFDENRFLSKIELIDRGIRRGERTYTYEKYNDDSYLRRGVWQGSTSVYSFGICKNEIKWLHKNGKVLGETAICNDEAFASYMPPKVNPITDGSYYYYDEKGNRSGYLNVETGKKNARVNYKRDKRGAMIEEPVGRDIFYMTYKCQKQGAQICDIEDVDTLWITPGKNPDDKMEFNSTYIRSIEFLDSRK